MRCLVAALLATLSCLCLAAGARADRMGESVHATLTSGTPTQYVFRGLVLKDKGWIGQAASDLTVHLLDSESLRISSAVGFWLSMHPGDLAEDGAGPAAWFESRLDGGLVLGIGDLSLDGRLVVYSSPNASFEDIYELKGVIAYNDDALFSGGDRLAVFRGFRPQLVMALEARGARDGRGSGAYLELGLSPTLHVLDGVALSADLMFPVRAGFSAGDYYEVVDSAGEVEDQPFGFASFGMILDLQLGFVPKRLGLWSLAGYLDAVLPVAQNEAANSDTDTLEFVLGSRGVMRF